MANNDKAAAWPFISRPHRPCETLSDFPRVGSVAAEGDYSSLERRVLAAMAADLLRDPKRPGTSTGRSPSEPALRFHRFR